MTDLEKMQTWLATFPNFDLLGTLAIDYTDRIPNTGGLLPSGLVEIGRREDILGNVTAVNQLNFGLYCRFSKDSGDDILAANNAQWVLALQRWVQEQSVRRLAPHFGNTDARESFRAQNGTLFDQDGDGTALYLVQLSVQFETTYEVS